MKGRVRDAGAGLVGACGQSGVTLIELMISMTIGLFVVMAATVLLMSTKSGYLMQDDEAQIQASGRFAIETVSRAVRQSAYFPWGGMSNAQLSTDLIGAMITGLDARSLKSSTQGIDLPVRKSVNGSDVLAVRFFGSGAGSAADGTMMNCAGFGVAGAVDALADDSRGWSIFYVAEDATGEPELYCKYQGASGWSSQAIARGVESFQVLYGLDTDADGLPNQFMTASVIDALDGTLVLEGVDAAARARDRGRKTNWKKVVAVRIAMLIHGAHLAGVERMSAEHDLFGKDYANAFADSDKGVRIRDAEMPTLQRGRVRRIFATTIHLRQPPPLSEASR